MTRLRDTNTCSYVLERRFGVAERMQALSPADLYVCSITLAEGRIGALKSTEPARLLAAWECFLAPFEERILSFDKDAARAYAISAPPWRRSVCPLWAASRLLVRCGLEWRSDVRVCEHSRGRVCCSRGREPTRGGADRHARAPSDWA